jgi:hypothetical protein
MLLRTLILLMLSAVVLLAACSPRFDWREIRSTEGGFSILMPDKPQTATREVNFDGRKVRMTVVSTGVGPTLFAASVASLPSESIAAAQLDATLAWFRNALLRNIDGQPIAVRPIVLSSAAAAGGVVRGGQSVDARGHVGRDGQSGQLAARFHVVDDRLYQVVAIGAQGELTADTLDTFFTSFRLLK